MKVTREKRAARLRICQACEHYTSSGTCGTPIVGNVLPDGRKLCGCFMHVKSWLKVGSCPIDKWLSEIDKSELDKLKAIVGRVKGERIGKADALDLAEWWRVNMKQERSTGNCCMPQLWQDSLKVLKDSEV